VALPAAGQGDLVVHQGLRALPLIEGSRRFSLIDLKAVEPLASGVQNRWTPSAGLGELGTVGAAYFLATQWRSLHRRHKRDDSFYALIECIGDDYRISRLLAEAPLTAE